MEWLTRSPAIGLSKSADAFGRAGSNPVLDGLFCCTIHLLCVCMYVCNCYKIACRDLSPVFEFETLILNTLNKIAAIRITLSTFTDGCNAAWCCNRIHALGISD